MDCRPSALSSMGFSRQEYWSGLPLPSSGDLSDWGIDPISPALVGGFFTTELPGKPKSFNTWWQKGIRTHTHIHKESSTTKIQTSFSHSLLIGKKIYLETGASQVAQGRESACQCRRHSFNLWVGKIPWRRKQCGTPVFLPEEPHG